MTQPVPSSAARYVTEDGKPTPDFHRYLRDNDSRTATVERAQASSSTTTAIATAQPDGVAVMIESGENRTYPVAVLPFALTVTSIETRAIGGSASVRFTSGGEPLTSYVSVSASAASHAVEVTLERGLHLDLQLVNVSALDRASVTLIGTRTLDVAT